MLYITVFVLSCVCVPDSVVICMLICVLCFFFKQKTAYEMRISDWSSDVCSSDLLAPRPEWVKVQRDEGVPVEKNLYRFILKHSLKQQKIGRASCRERVCQYV